MHFEDSYGVFGTGKTKEKKRKLREKFRVRFGYIFLLQLMIVVKLFLRSGILVMYVSRMTWLEIRKNMAFSPFSLVEYSA